MERSPRWKIAKPVTVDKSYKERREQLQQEKVENLKKSWDDRKIKFIDDVSISYFNNKYGKRGGFKYSKVQKLKFNSTSISNKIIYIFLAD